MKRFAIILLAVATALVMALPATAKKPVPEPEPPTTYTVEIGFRETGGISTTCDGLIWDEATESWVVVPLILTRNDEPSGLVSHFETFDGVELQVSGDGLAWGEAVISGCHGPGLLQLYDIDGALTDSSVTRQPAPGYFRITLENDGSVAMLWIFDVYQREQIIKEFKKKTLWDITERTDFRMGGPYDENGDFVSGVWEDGVWEDSGGVINFTVTGQFNFVHFTRGGDPLFENLAKGTRFFTLDITLTPVI